MSGHVICESRLELPSGGHAELSGGGQLDYLL
jgi:hypothetical protein